MPFDKIDGVKMVKKIGEGGFATIFAGTYKDKKVAIKKPQQGENSSINYEIKVIKKIADFKDKHPDQESYSSCIITYYGFYSSYGNNIVMEYADYGNLSDWILKNKNSFNEQLPPFNWSFGYPILKNITYALSFLHNQLNLIHSDVKTENILLFKSENDQEIVKAKLCDFGLTVEKGTKKLLGNAPIYSAPEILNKTSYPSEKSDVYGLACIIWEMETQRQLYSEFVYKTINDFKYYINSGNRAKIPSRNPKIEMLIEGGWSSEEQRFTIDLYEEAVKTDIDTISEKLQEEQRKTFKTDNDFIGANPNYDLFDAINNGNVDTVKTLLEKKATINEITIFGSHLHFAVINKKHEIAELLLKSKANVNLEMEPGVDALTLATRDNDHDMVKLLLKYGADPRNALLDAIQNRDIDRVELLLNYKVNVNLELESGMDAFQLAIKKNNLEMVNLLLKYGADKTKEDKKEAPKEQTKSGLIKLSWLGEKERSTTKPYLNAFKTDIDTISEELQQRSELNLNP